MISKFDKLDIEKLDKYYTPFEICKRVKELVDDVLGLENFDRIIEPCAGDGRLGREFSALMFDIAPESDDVLYMDIFNHNIGYKKNTLVITNPPYFGRKYYRNSGLNAFLDQCFSFSDDVVLLRLSTDPKQPFNKEYSLNHYIDLGIVDFGFFKKRCGLYFYKKKHQKVKILKGAKIIYFKTRGKDQLDILKQKEIYKGFLKDIRLISFGIPRVVNLDSEIYAGELGIELCDKDLVEPVKKCICDYLEFRKEKNGKRRLSISKKEINDLLFDNFEELRK